MHRKKYPAKHRNYDRRRYKRREASRVVYQYRKLYGITKDQYDAMLAEQGGRCLLCFGINADGRRLSVDHNHKTGKVRGLLCSQCNTGIGLFRDNPELLRMAIQYIEGGE
jgi:hypothetical protein